MKKQLKFAVDYSRGKKATHCGNCKAFIEPHGCKKVAGKIDSDMWCKLWHKR